MAPGKRKVKVMKEKYKNLERKAGMKLYISLGGKGRAGGARGKHLDQGKEEPRYPRSDRDWM